MSEKYPGLELENFDKAHVWRKYIFFLIKKYLRDALGNIYGSVEQFSEESYDAVFTTFDADNSGTVNKSYIIIIITHS